MHPDSTVLATGGYMAADKLKPYLAQKEIFLAPSRERVGQQMGEYLSEVFPKAKRIQPGQAESWNEYRQLQLKEAKEKKEQEAKHAQAAAKARNEAFSPAPNTNRSSGLSR